MSKLELGAGLIGIGRIWGHVETPVPTESEAQEFLKTAFKLGIRYFDTAPSYGKSEARLGKFVSSLATAKRDSITIATKFGEHWNERDQEPYPNHAYAALTRSIDQSMERLGRIDVLQVHKTNPDILRSDDLHRAIEYAQERGITVFGASVSDVESGRIVCEDPTYSVIQLPFNQQNQKLGEIVRLAQTTGKTVVVNRPFNMGEVLYQVGKALTPEEQRIEAYRFISREVTAKGIVLTGTKSPSHLEENVEAFQKALKK